MRRLSSGGSQFGHLPLGPPPRSGAALSRGGWAAVSSRGARPQHRFSASTAPPGSMQFPIPERLLRSDGPRSVLERCGRCARSSRPRGSGAPDGEILMAVIPDLPLLHREWSPLHDSHMYACTARDVKRPERAWNKGAQAALHQERDQVRSWGAIPRIIVQSPGQSCSDGRTQFRGHDRAVWTCLRRSWRRKHVPLGKPGRGDKGRASYRGNNVKARAAAR